MPDLRGLRVTLVLARSDGGVGAHLRSLVPGLAARGARVAVLGPAATDELFGFQALGATFAPVEIGAGPRPVRDALTVRRLRRLLAGPVGAADIVHAHGLRAGLLAGLAGRRAPYVVTLHNAVLATGLRRVPLTGLEWATVRRADVVLAASADLAEHARRLGARDVRLAPVAAPPPPRPSREPAAVRAELGAAGRPLLLGIGRLHEQKGFDVLLAAAARLPDRMPVVAVAGAGPLEPELRRQAAAHGVCLRLLGRRADIADLLAAADVVVLPSRWEARALVAQEALLAGRPLVATPVGGLADLLGDAAVLVPPDDPAALAAALRTLLDDPAAAAALAERGRRRAATWPTEPEMLDALAALYLQLSPP